MALVGRLEDLELTELFHVLSLFKKSGTLTLRSESTTGVFRFAGGKIVHAANGHPRPSLGALLLQGGHISEEVLDEALAEQASRGGGRLSTILVENRAVAPETVETIVRRQLQEITEEFLHLRSGFFSFKPADEAAGPSRSDDIVLDDGMNTDQFILDLLTRLDEVDEMAATTRSPSETQPISSVARATALQETHQLVEYMVDAATYAADLEPDDEASGGAETLADLRSLMVELQLRRPTFAGEIGLMILRYACTVVDRGLLMHVGSDELEPVGQFGVGTAPGAAPAGRALRATRIPIHEPSVFLEVLESLTTYHGPLRRCGWNDRLINALGGHHPPEVIVIPIVVDGLVTGMFYGDNGPTGRPVTAANGLELLSIEAGLVMERSLLRQQLEQTEQRLRSVTTDGGEV